MTAPLTCQHCHSTEIISVQGEYFCVSCGQIVTNPGAASKPKRGPGRPKASRLDQPKISVLPAEPITAAETITQPEPIITLTTTPVPTEELAPVAQAMHAPTTSLDGLKSRVAEEIAPVVTTPKVRVRPVRTKLPWGAIIAAPLHAYEAIAVLAALPGALVLVVALGTTTRSMSNPPYGLIATISFGLAALILLGVARTQITIIQAAHDNHRPRRLYEAWRLALELAPRLLLARLIFLIEVLFGAAVALAVIWYGRLETTLDNRLHITLLFIVLYLVAMRLVAHWVRHSLLEAAMIMGDLSFNQARHVMKRISLRRLDLLGAKMLSVVFWVGIGGGLIYIARQGNDLLGGADGALIGGVAAVLIATTGYVVTTAVMTGEIYRHLVRALPPLEAAPLTAMARTPAVKGTHRTLTLMAVIVLLVIGIGCAAIIISAS